MKFYEPIALDFERISSQEQSIAWHQNCYKSYTSKHNLEPFMKKDQEDFVIPSSDDEGMRIKTCSAAPELDWKLCTFCYELTYKKSRN